MYYTHVLEISRKTPKVTKKNINGTNYVYYEYARDYDKKSQQSKPKRRIIGKAIEVTDELIRLNPNETYYHYFPNAVIPEKYENCSRSKCLRIGSYIVIKKIISDYRIDEMISDIIGKDSGLFLDFAAYSIVAEDNAGQYYPNYAYNHALFSIDMHVYSDSKISRMLNEITTDQAIEFLNKWNEGRNHRERIYYYYDASNKNDQAGNIEMAEYGKPKDDQGKPVINIAVAYDEKNREPLFYEYYPGSIPDIAQLQYMLETAAGFGYRNIGFILDRGYFSKSNIKYMDQHGYSFIIMIKGKKDLVKKLISENRGKFEKDRHNYIKEYGVSGFTVEHLLYEGDEKTRYFHLYYSYEKYTAERSALEDKLSRMERIMTRNKGKVREYSEEFHKYYIMYYGYKGDVIAFQEKMEEIEEETNYFGYFAIVTSEKMSAREALMLYKGRDSSEKLFRGDKSYLGSRTERTAKNEPTESKLFIEFIGMIIRNKIYTSLIDYSVKSGNYNNYLTVPAAIGELEKIEMICRSDGIYRMSHSVTAREKIILEAFDIDEEHVKREVCEIQEKLKRSNEESKNDSSMSDNNA